jgi:hypothetical protein
MNQRYNITENYTRDSFLNDPNNFKLPFDVFGFIEFNREIFTEYDDLVGRKLAYYQRIKDDPNKAETAQKMYLDLNKMVSVMEVLKAVEQGYVSAWAEIQNTWQAELESEKSRTQEYYKYFLSVTESEKMFLDMALNCIATPSKTVEQ